MGTTKQIARDDWNEYFERFTRQHLGDDVPKAVTIELVSPRLGDQLEASDVRLLGITYDPKSRAVKVFLEDRDHLVFEPAEIWVLEGESGFISTLEFAYEDGSKEIIYVRVSGPPARRYPQPAPPQG